MNSSPEVLCISGDFYNYIIATAFAVQHKELLCVGLFVLQIQIADDDVTTVYSNCVFHAIWRALPARLRFAEVNT